MSYAILKQRSTLEVVLLCMFFIALILFSSVFEMGKLDHEYPVQLGANDMLIFNAFSQVPQQYDDMKDVPDFLSGNHDDALNFFSPLAGIVNAQLASAAGVETHNILIHFNIIILTLAALCMYIVLRRLSVHAALLSLPLFLLLFKWPFTFIVYWGGMIGNMNMMLVVVTILAFLHLEKKGMWFVLGLLNAASFLSHGREFQSFNLAIVLVFLVYFIKEKAYTKVLNFSQYKKYFKEDHFFVVGKNFVYSVIVSTLAIFPWWKALGGFMSSHGNNGGWIVWNYAPKFHQVTFSHLGLFTYLTVIGLALTALYIYQKQDRDVEAISVISFFFILSGVIMFFGNNLPQARAFYLFTFMPFITMIGIFIFSMIKKEHIKHIVTAILFVCVLGYVSAAYAPDPIPVQGVLHPQQWEAQMWINDNMNDGEEVLVLFCNSCQQKASFLPAQVPYHLVQIGDYTKAIKTGQLTSTYLVDTFPVHHKFNYNESSQSITAGYIPGKIEKNLCEYKYLYFEFLSQEQAFAQYAGLIGEKLITEYNFELIYNNELAAVLQNNNQGGECFENEIIQTN